ncbi:hypothetical protein MKW94_014351 [Papaver nudicaule]|uniref:Uncharacterized protein n=1 Tax=Papaver nudicaule TaxID=74823 RepID=A0AA41S2P4_PAPNU|nr:hypothetical protein [Papaver nudicaule]
MNGSESSYSPSVSSAPIANWKISSPGDHPEEVKARLKFWAQAVACTKLKVVERSKIPCSCV